MTPDVNVLVAASRTDHPHHGRAHSWLTEALAAPAPGAPLVLLPMVTSGFMRVVTNRKVFPDPTPPARAVAFVRALLDYGAVMGSLGTEWPILARLCEDAGIVGGDVTDAWIAAAVQANAEHLVSFDRGFRRFLKNRELTVLRR